MRAFSHIFIVEVEVPEAAQLEGLKFIYVPLMATREVSLPFTATIGLEVRQGTWQSGKIKKLIFDNAGDKFHCKSDLLDWAIGEGKLKTRSDLVRILAYLREHGWELDLRHHDELRNEVESFEARSSDSANDDE